MQPTILSNCEPDDDINLLIRDDNMSTENCSGDESDSSSSMIQALSSISTMSTIDVSALEEYEAKVTLENCSNTYFAGYLGNKSFKKFKCDSCSNVMIKSDEENQLNEQEFLIFCRNYDSKTSDIFLKRPTHSFTQFITLAQQIIKKTVEIMPHKKSIRQFLFDKIKSDLSNICKFNESCTDHFNYIIIHFINCKLLRDFNWKSKNIKSTRVEKNVNKLSILTNT